MGSERNRLFLWETPDDEDTKVWETYHEYFDHVRKHGIRQNMVLLAGHETAHISVMGNKPIIRTPLEQRKKIEEHLLIAAETARVNGIKLEKLVELLKLFYMED